MTKLCALVTSPTRASVNSTRGSPGFQVFDLWPGWVRRGT